MIIPILKERLVRIGQENLTTHDYNFHSVSFLRKKEKITSKLSLFQLPHFQLHVFWIPLLNFISESSIIVLLFTDNFPLLTHFELACFESLEGDQAKHSSQIVFSLKKKPPTTLPVAQKEKEKSIKYDLITCKGQRPKNEKGGKGGLF